MPYETERDVAVEAALRAGTFIRSHAGRLDRSDVHEKGLHDLITFVDLEADRMIVETLGAAFPDHGFLTEEGTKNTAVSPGYSGSRWIVDPVDGTTNFTHNLPPFAVSIGLQKDGELVAGVVYEVARGELFTATKGGGLYVNGRRAGVSKQSDLHRSLVTTGFPYREHTYIDAYIEVMRALMLGAQGLRRPGAASVDFAYLACGRLDGFFEIGLSPWDIAAGALLVEEGGGRVSTFGGDDQYLFGRQLIASNGLLHDDLLEAVGPLREAMKGESA